MTMTVIQTRAMQIA